MTRGLSLTVLIAATMPMSCSKISGDPVRSYCEATCDWAVSCAAAERPIDEAAKLSECLAATEATDDGCAKASSGEMDPVSKEALEPCVTAIDDAATAGECDAFTGSIDEIKQGTPPSDCLSQGTDAQATFDAARGATAETGDELCQRVTDTYCAKAESCIVEDLGEIPENVVTVMGGTPYELCLQRLDPVFTADCKSSSLYTAPDGFVDANAARESARECMRDFSVVSCDAMFTGNGMDPVCAGSFASNDQLLAVAGALATLAQDYADAMGATTP